MKQENGRRLLLIFILIAAAYFAYSQPISRITMQPMRVIYICDTALIVDSISSKMGKDYSKLFMVIGEQQLSPGKFMAIYHTSQAPWIFDVAVEINKMPVMQDSQVRFKITDSGDAIILHFKGAYEKMDTAYLQIGEWLKQNGKQGSGPSIEVYLNDPSMVKSRDELRTDIYQLIR